MYSLPDLSDFNRPNKIGTRRDWALAIPGEEIGQVIVTVLRLLNSDAARLEGAPNRLLLWRFDQSTLERLASFLVELERVGCFALPNQCFDVLGINLERQPGIIQSLCVGPQPQPGLGPVGERQNDNAIEIVLLIAHSREVAVHSIGVQLNAGQINAL